MADYEPTNWSCGETITAERMNKIERGVADIMSEYVPTEWSCGDVITAEKLNKIEQAIANADCGGGSSDFSTAEVTFTVDAGISMYVAELLPTGYVIAADEGDVEENTVTVVLFNGAQIVSVIPDEPLTHVTAVTTGEVSWDDENTTLFIEGDGTAIISIVS